VPGYLCITCHYVYVKSGPATDAVIDRYTAVVITANDYYPFELKGPLRLILKGQLISSEMKLYYFLFYCFEKLLSSYFARMLVGIFQIFFMLSLFRLYVLESFGAQKDNIYIQTEVYKTACIIFAIFTMIVHLIMNFDSKIEKFSKIWSSYSKVSFWIRFILTLTIFVFISFFLVPFVNLFRQYW
jgi:hypothetical protein